MAFNFTNWWTIWSMSHAVDSLNTVLLNMYESRSLSLPATILVHVQLCKILLWNGNLLIFKGSFKSFVKEPTEYLLCMIYSARKCTEKSMYSNLFIHMKSIPSFTFICGMFHSLVNGFILIIWKDTSMV